MFNPVRRQRRTLSMALLCLCTGMLIWGNVVLEPWLRGPAGRFYWIACGAVAGLAVWTSLGELAVSLIHLHRSRTESRRRLDRAILQLQPTAPARSQTGRDVSLPAPQDTV